MGASTAATQLAVISKIFSVPPLGQDVGTRTSLLYRIETKLWTINTTTNIEQNHTECQIGIIRDMDINFITLATKNRECNLEKIVQTDNGMFEI